MDIKVKQQWSDEETQCFLTLWASEEIQGKLEGASRTKPVYVELQREMAAAGYARSVDQLLNKLKKLKKDFRDQKRKMGLSGSGRLKKNPHFELLESVLEQQSDTDAATKALNTAAAMIDLLVESVPQTKDSDPLVADVSKPLTFKTEQPKASQGGVDDEDEESCSGATGRDSELPTENMAEHHEDAPSTSTAQLETLPAKKLYRVHLLTTIAKTKKEMVLLDRQIRKADLEILLLERQLRE